MQQAPVADSDVTSDAVAVKIWLNIVIVSIVAEIAIEFAIIVVAWISNHRTPHLFAGFDIAPERGDSCRRDHRSVDASARLRTPEHNCVSIADEELQPGIS